MLGLQLNRTLDITITCVLVIIKKVSIVAKAVVASISIVAVMVTPTIVGFTFFNICNNRNLNYIYMYIYISLDMILSANHGSNWPSLLSFNPMQANSCVQKIAFFGVSPQKPL